MKNAKIIQWVAGLLLVALLVVLGFQFGFFQFGAVYEARDREKEQVNLPDGSFVQLNAGSTLRFREKDFVDRRIVRLEGEGMFYIRRGNGGFLVKTKQGLIRVLGTDFNVYARDDGFEVTCYLGKIEVRKDGEILPLEIGEKAVWDGTQFQKTTTHYERPTWIGGEAVFKDAPLQKVLDEVERQYGIRFRTELSRDYTYTGGIPHQELQTAMDNIADALDLKYEQDERIMYLTDKKD